MQYHASHSITCNVPPERVYKLIRRSRDWPEVLEPCEAVTVLAESLDAEHIQISARINGESMTWQSRRRFLPEVFGVEATVVQPMKLVKAMTAAWRVIGLNSTQSVLVLEHDYSLCGDITGQVPGVTTRAEAERFIERAIDVNSTVELGNIKAAAERADGVKSDRDFSVRHSVVCEADADTVYSLIRTTDSWPRIFDACLSATPLGQDDSGELVRVEALQNGRRVAWDTRRRTFDEVRRVEYHLPVPMPFLESMRGEWRVVPLNAERCLLTVDRNWRLLADVRGIRDDVATVAQAAAVVRDFVDGNADAEMLAIRAWVEDHTNALTSFTSRYRLPHTPDQVYSALADVARWPQMLPHCESLDLLYDDGSHQEFVMKVQTASGLENFRSVRHCDERTLTIVYFQPQSPPVMRRHSGSWQVRGAEGGSEVIARRAVLLDVGVCAQEFGTDDLRLLKGRVRELLERNSRSTVEACGRWLDGAVASTGTGPAVPIGTSATRSAHDQ